MRTLISFQESVNCDDINRIVIHAPGAPGLRLLGLGPGLRPVRSLCQLQQLLDQHSSWAQGRNLSDLRSMLANSAAVVSLWDSHRLIGFARASSDGVYRAVLWDVVLAEEFRGLGLGRKLVESLLKSSMLKNVERIYLMTTNGSGFYQQLGFDSVESQKLLLLNSQNEDNQLPD